MRLMLFCLLLNVAIVHLAEAQDQQPPKPIAEASAEEAPKPLAVLPEQLAKELKTATSLNPDGTVLIDPKKKQVFLRTEVACPDCVLEMVLVPEGNREHETILRIRSAAWVIHSALLAIGLEPGKPAEFTPEFTPPTGPVLQIEAMWLDTKKGELRKVEIQHWVRHNTRTYRAVPLPFQPAGIEFPYKNLRWDKFNNELLWFGPMSDEDRDDLLSQSKNKEYQAAIRKFHSESQLREMKADFVFAGSRMFRDDETGKEIYQAEGGHLICTSNFGDAMIDIREESTSADGAQTYEGWPERIPPVGTPVILVLQQKKVAADEKGADAP